ncbi:leucine-rich repeat domain-containing protein [Mastigocoleus testarum]|uniref:non-specific serine/threonine protein kinase n=1 Tax=Mastigocoleus testarum BC008 TaxID=371196 RepID=A0A0V7ZQ05_9CYAN|nr:COR domain-containing protein [Mastigocoleus testarum]KST66804.1 GTPase [Mastigocoleus testarum BC008]
MTGEDLLHTIKQAVKQGVTELDLSGSELTVVPPEIGQLTNLQSLNLYNNQLTALPSEIGELTNLQSLNLYNNQLTVLPPEIGKLTNLQLLDLYNNQLISLPLETRKLTNLQSLNLYNNQLTTLLPEIGQLTNLQSLNLYNNQLSILPSEIGKLTNLQSLDLSNNQLTSLPKEFGQLNNLLFLYLEYNQLDTLPVGFGQLKNLLFLDCYNNQLSGLPEEIGQLTNLQSLYLRNNKLASLSEKIGQLNNLLFLDLDGNQLSSLPAGIVQLSNLQSLDLRNNQLTSFPQEILKLSNLQSLLLYNNQLSYLPEEIVQLSNLQSLDLGRNQLTSLPEEIVQLINLQSLYLSRNQLSSLPADIRKLTKLEKLDLRGNPVPIPPEILGEKELWRDPGDINEIFDFYFSVQDPNETEPLYEAKLLILGEGGAGKTSLAKKIEDENYKLKSDEESTEGIDVIQWKFPLPNGKEFRVNIWDFGGQAIYHQTHQFFLTKRSLYALVVDTRRENTDFYWWMKVAELLSDGSSILIIKNEKQDRQCEVNERQLRGEFTNLKEVLATNLADNRGLAKIKEEIQNQIVKLPHVGDKSPLPKIWVRIRSALDNYSRNYITLHEYYQLCETNHLTDRQDMLRLSSYLHDLGVCLHFQDDSTLKHYVILKPEWSTTAVYKVLDNKTVRKNLGCFTQEQLTDIWKDDEYADMRDELLQLMMRFKLCYPIPNRPKHYIAPQLLDIEQPEYIWDKSNNLILRYKYEFMPKGIITRFIVETHPWIEQQRLVWRSGVILNKDETRTEVIENYNQREIKVSVSGNRKKELLAVITHELEKIHASFERLEYEIKVPCNCEECVGTENPYVYPLKELRKRLNKGRFQIECGNSYDMVDVRRLIDDVNLLPQPENWEFQVQNTSLQGDLEKERDLNLNVKREEILENPQKLGENRGKKLKKIRDAIISAYPDKADLEMMVYFQLEENLDSIAGGENTKQIVFKLIKWAESESKLEQLVKGACEDNPENTELKTIREDINWE